jgi:hypothetical protein
MEYKNATTNTHCNLKRRIKTPVSLAFQHCTRAITQNDCTRQCRQSCNLALVFEHLSSTPFVLAVVGCCRSSVTSQPLQLTVWGCLLGRTARALLCHPAVVTTPCLH